MRAVTCQHCGAEVPDGEYCTRCGAHRSRGSTRLHDFVIRPGEHVATPAILSTLLPRLEHSQVHRFRWALLAGVAVVALLAATGLVIPAIWVAALIVPALYISYLRGVDVFAREPLLVLFGTIVAGAVVGVAVTAAADGLGSGLGPGGVILLTCGVAVVAELLKPAAPLLLLRRHFPHTLDGLVLGVAAGAGYALAQTLVNLVGGLGGAQLKTDPANWVFTLFSAALLIPLLHGSCTGLVAASLWRPRGGRDAALRAAGLPLAVIADVGFTAGSEVLDDAGLSPFFVLLWQALVVGAVLVAIRLLIHAAVLDEAAELGVREVVCHHCGRHVEAAGFCPHCGAAIAVEVVAVEPALSR
jgi:RsiW-degrading membrane proteinase PrsW (M82 family)